jgi:hypothetical protein
MSQHFTFTPNQSSGPAVNPTGNLVANPIGDPVATTTGSPAVHLPNGTVANFMGNTVANPLGDPVVTSTDNPVVGTSSGPNATSTVNPLTSLINDPVVTHTNNFATNPLNGSAVNHTNNSTINHEAIDQIYEMIKGLSDQVNQLALGAPRPHHPPEDPINHHQPRTQNWLHEQHREAQETAQRRNAYDYVPLSNRAQHGAHTSPHRQHYQAGPSAEARWRNAASYQAHNYSPDQALGEGWTFGSGFDYGPMSQACRLANLRPDQSLAKFAAEADEDPYAWLRAFENVARARCWTTYNDKKAVLPSYLMGRAERWWLHMERRLNAWGDEPWAQTMPSDQTFVGAFTRAFIPPAFACIWRKEFENASQEQGEFPLDFHYRIADLVDRLRMFEPIEEEQAIRVLIKGLVGDLKQEMIKRYSDRQIPTLDEAADHILKLTTMYQEFDQPDKYYIPSNNQATSTDRKKMTSRYTLQAQVKKAKKSSPSSPVRKKENDKPEVKTLKSGRTIPLDANGNPTTPCPRCGQPGHWKADCPRKEKQGFRSSRPS